MEILLAYTDIVAQYFFIRILHCNFQDEGVKDLIEMTLRKMDRDKDGRVSLADWKVFAYDIPVPVRYKIYTDGI